MSDITRLKETGDFEGGTLMVPDEAGEYVRYDDIAHLLAAVPADQGAREPVSAKRYSPALGNTSNWDQQAPAIMEEDEIGEYVRFEDYALLERCLFQMQNAAIQLAAASQGAQEAEPLDPMDWPLPCDVTVGAGTMRKGVSLRTLVMRMEVLHRMAMKNAAPAAALQEAAQPVAWMVTHPDIGDDGFSLTADKEQDK